MESLVAYLVTAMISWVPLYAQGRHETLAEARARYESIARDVAAVVMDEEEQPLFGGKNGRAETAVLMLSVASYESSFRKSVDVGTGRGDNGNSYCLMQLHVGNGTTPEGWSGTDLVEDRQRCLRAGLHMLRRSFAACHDLALDDRLSAYATGHCLADVLISRSRVNRARAYWETHAAPPLAPEAS